jgi:hypothetical protein
MLQTWHDLLESPTVPVLQTRTVYTVNRASAAALAVLARKPRVGAIGLEFSAGWNETNGRRDGFFDTAWGGPSSWRDVILQGSHLYVDTPIYREPNETMAHQTDWSRVDLEALAEDAIPVTSYKPQGNRSVYDAAYTHWGADRSVAARDRYRVAWRRMADNVAMRTLVPALIPPGAAHIHAVASAGFVERRARDLALVQGFAGSLVGDFLVRVVPKSGIQRDAFERLVIAPADHPLTPAIVLRVLRLNCLTRAYADFWHDALASTSIEDAWTGGIDYPGRPRLGDVTAHWTPESPLRRASDRRHALVELDALVAVALELSADELCTIYRANFPVLYGYDRTTSVYDVNGRLVPNAVLNAWRKKGDDDMTEDERTATNASGNTYVYEPPFTTLDRELDMRTAYARFERVLKDRLDG